MEERIMTSTVCIRLRAFAIAAVLALAGGLFGCATAARNVQPLEVQLVSLALLGAGADAQRFRVGFDVRNPNALAIPVEQLGFNVRLAGSGVLQGRAVEPFTLDANATRTVQIDVEGNLVASVSRLIAMVQGPEATIPYDLDGMITLSRGFNRSLPFSHRGQVPLAMPSSR
jgi:LEA14-like dessication related protein